MLNYLFIAETLNHNLIRQTQDDTSRLLPGKNAFYDVMQHQGKIRKFSLVGKGHMISIDLIDGHAEVDGVVVNPPKAPPIGKPLDLIYYKQMQQRLMVKMDGSGSTLEPITRFYIGWQCTYQGKNHKWELGID